MKSFSIHGLHEGGSTAQVRLELFNAFNWVNLNNPSTNVNSANFGKVTGARGGTGGPRIVQIGLKYTF